MLHISSCHTILKETLVPQAKKKQGPVEYGPFAQIKVCSLLNPSCHALVEAIFISITRVRAQVIPLTKTPPNEKNKNFTLPIVYLASFWR
jgi:hypothetical protein